MTTQLAHRLFNVDEYHQMADAGILDEDSNVELIEGELLLLHPEAGRPPGSLRLFNIDEYYRMAEFGILDADDRVELIEGEIVEMAPIGGRHAATVTRLTKLLSVSAGNRADVSIQNPVKLSDLSVPQPDAALLLPVVARDNRLATAGDVLLIVEVADTTLESDREIKLPLYARAGVPEVWIIALNDDAIEAYRQPSMTGYGTKLVAKRGEILAPLALPQLELAVDEVLGPRA